MEIYWLIIAAVLLLAGQSVIVRVLKLKGVRYERKFSTDVCFEGDQIELVETIRNERWFPVPWIRLESIMSAHLKFETKDNLDIQAGELFQNHKSLFSLMPYTEITRRHKVTCTKRGHYRLETVTLSYGDAIGLYTDTETKPMQAQLTVYPKPVPMDELPISSDSLQGDVSVRRWLMDDPFMTRGVREYQPGDALRSISWNATARTGKLQVFERDYTADPRLFVCINVETHEKMWKHVTEPERIERGIQLAASWLQFAIDNGWDAGLGCNGCLAGDAEKKPIRTEVLGGEKHLTDLYEIMARIEIERSIPIEFYLEEEARRAERRTDYVLITSFVSDQMNHWLQLLKNQGHGVTIVPLHEEKFAERQVAEGS